MEAGPRYVGSQASHTEEAVRSAASASKTVVEYSIKKQIQREEEDADHVADLLDRGLITQAEAAKMTARAKMHRQEDAAGRNSIDAAVAAGAGVVTSAQVLEDYLDMDPPESFIGRILWAAQMERRRRRSSEFRHPVPLLKKMVDSFWYELFMGILMIVNGVLIGVPLQGPPDDQTLEILDTIEHVFIAVFLVDIGLRVGADGWPWLFDGLSFADVVLVFFTGVMPMWFLAPAGVSVDQIKVFQILRALRLVRLVRLFRMSAAFRALWKLLCGMSGAWRTFIHINIVLFTIVFTFSVFAVYAFGRLEDEEGNPIVLTSKERELHCKPNTKEREIYCKFYYFHHAMFSLFQFVTFDDWSGMAKKIYAEDSLFGSIVLTAIILIAGVVFNNLVTGTFVNAVAENGRKDEELQAKLREDFKKAKINELADIFMDIDSDGSGTLSKDEYMDAVRNNEAVRAILAVLQVSGNEADEIWELIDTGTGEVTVDQFATVMTKLHGEARARDSFSSVQRIRHLNTKMGKLSARLSRYKSMVEDLRKDVVKVDIEMSKITADLREFIFFCGECVPSASAPVAAITVSSFKKTVINRCQAAQNSLAQTY